MGESVAKRAHTILKQLIAIEEPMRSAELARLCEGDAELLGRVNQLLDALSKADGFLESPIGRTVRDAARSLEQPCLPSIRGFKIERLVGVGGMAAVYEAMQDLPRRRVALKVLRRSMAGTAALRRFEFETEVLAKLKHPGIAQIYEVGAFDDGAGAIPFFAMEFIDGARTLTRYCDDEGLDIRARIELMVQVCDAVQHGHQNGVIHRDLKPGNVLVDVSGAPRVIDFGIARSTVDEAQGQQTTMGQIVGTLNAMSPEQCTPNGSVDARTDVYSLGVLLYELLCRRPPHDLGSLPIPEALRVIHDVAPRRPSVLDPRLRGDLDAIVLKAIEKDPDRRYRTAAALGADLRRHLDHQTVEARPPTILYQLRLLARRNRTAVTAVIIVALSLLAATAISVVAAIRANHSLEQRVLAEGRARDERDTALRKTYIASIAAALSACQFDEYTKARRHLDAAPVEHRGWEWRWMNGFTDRSVASVDAHRVMIASMSASADGSRLMSAAADGSVRSWTSPELAPLANFRLGGGEINGGEMFPDGSRMVTVSDDGTAVIASAVDGTIERTLRDAGGSFDSVSVRLPGTLAIATAAGELLIWDVDSDAPEKRLTDQPGGVDGVRFSQDGSQLVTWSTRGLVRLRDAQTLATVQEWPVGSSVASVDIRPDLDRLAIGCAHGRVVIEIVSSGAEAVVLGVRDQLSLVRSVTFSHDGALIAIGQGTGAITVAETATTGLYSVGVGHREAVSALAFSPDDKRLISSSWDGSLRAWDMERPTTESTRPLHGHEQRVMSVDFDRSTQLASRSASKSRLVSASADGTVRVWNPERDEEIAVLRGHSAEVYDAKFSPDGSLIASAGFDRTVRLWNVERAEEVAVLTGHTRPVWTVDFSPDGGTLASGGDDRTIRLWDVATGALLRTLEGHTGRVIDVAFSHDGRRLASASADHSVRIWSLDETNGGAPESRVLLGHEWDVFAVAWGLDDAELYSGSRDQTIRIWSPATGEALALLDDARQFITSLALSPDGTRLIAGTWFSGLCIFDPRSRELIASFKPVTEVVRGVAFSADGRFVAVASGDGVVRLLDGASATERAGR